MEALLLAHVTMITPPTTPRTLPQEYIHIYTLYHFIYFYTHNALLTLLLVSLARAYHSLLNSAPGWPETKPQRILHLPNL